ncbi:MULTISPECIES: glycoside hydrolase family 27 protein [Clostridium]|uniref:Alpha-galactosidase n=1 Tax=Clostridium saudiense TaxID=1414720 RepID=A0ABS2FF90_9CLOT|nr:MULTISPECIES: glycoside hydrolase family 27 protein [Clostridium]MBM6818636.1 glycoside hydrolase family 27 protein [Clostridium saudiense]
MNKNTFAQTPPMGWNSYDYYDTTVNESQIKANADYMAKYLKEYGWEYIIIDIQWYAHNAGSMRKKFQYIPFSELEIDEYSRLQPDPKRFPSSINGAGFAPLAKYIHSLGLKFGIHIMRGIPRTAAHNHTKIKDCSVTADMIADPSSICGWNPDMYGVRNTSEGQAYYDSLIELYASWGVDFIKCDDICNTNIYPENQYSAKHEIEMLAKAIQKCGRPIVLSLSPGPALIDKAWHYEKYANMWRITDDFWDNWTLLKDMFYRCELWQNHVSEGCYPDCDMLPLGYLGKGFGEERVTNFTKDEQQTMMTLWCLFGSPLMLGAEMTKLDDFTLSLLTNKKVLAMLTPDCKPKQISLDDTKAIWFASNNKTNKKYVALFNLSDEIANISVNLEELDILKTEVTLTDLWTNNSSKNINKIISKELAPHASAVYEIYL